MGVARLAGAAAKATPAGRVAAVAGASGAGKGRPKGGRRIHSGMSREQVNAELQARREDAAGGGDDQGDDQADAASRSGGLPGWATDQRGAPSWWKAPDPVATANTGSGFLLGVVAWALGLAYLRGGGDEVKKLIKAKAFNQTGG